MAANARLVRAGNAAVVTPPAAAGGDAPNVAAVVLSDGSANVARALDNGDGTATLAVDTRAVGTVTSASNTGAAAAAVSASLAAQAGKTNYITGFSVTSTNPAAVVNGTVTVTGVAGGTLSYQFVEAVATGGQLVINFPTPLPASAVNTAITVNLPAITSGGAGAVTVHGFAV